jgi:hypothetical protein
LDPNEIADWNIDFDISERLEFTGKISDSNTIKFRKVDNYITGFTVTVKNSTMEDAERKGREKARNLKNILTIKSGIPLEEIFKSLESIPKPGQDKHIQGEFVLSTGGIKGGIDNLDLNDSNIQSIINSREPQNLKYEYFTKGIFYYYNSNPVDCIKESFRVIEDNKNFYDYYKYKVLRDIFSHKPPYIKETIELFDKCFSPNPFECKKFEPQNGWIIIDLDSNKNQRLLNKIAIELRSQIRKFFKYIFLNTSLQCSQPVSFRCLFNPLVIISN